MMILQTHIVPDGVPPTRLSDYACEIVTIIPSRKGVKKAIKKGEVLVDGVASGTGTWVRPGQRIDLISLDPRPPKTYELSLSVVYEDGEIALIDKPAGMAVNGNRFRTVEHALTGNLSPSSAPDALPWPRPVHRLDSATSGLLLVAKTARALVHLGRQFESREVAKRYRAVVIGRIGECGSIDSPVEGRDALTEYAPVRAVHSLKNGWLTLVDLWPHTGRTHQLRVHLARSGFPILGDRQYGEEGMILKSKGLFLCAVEISFIHPATEEPVTVAINEPEKFRTFLEREARRWGKYNKGGDG